MKYTLYSLFFVSVFSFSLKAEDLGSCRLTQDSQTGEYTIVCSGDTSSGSFTNCVELKQQLLSEVNSLSSSINSMGYNLGRDYMNASDAWGNYLPNMQYYNEWNTAVQACQGVVDSYQRQLYDLSANVQTGDLYKAISRIECAECSSSGDDSGGSCTCNVNVEVDLSEIVTLMNDAQDLRQHISDTVDSVTNYLLSIVSSLQKLEGLTSLTNSVADISSYLGPYLSYSGSSRYARMDWNYRTGDYTFNTSSALPNVTSQAYRNIITLLQTVQTDLLNGITSLNNYHGLYTQVQFPVLTNLVGQIYSQTLFENTAVLGAFSSTADSGQSYRDFLTNYYIKAVTGRISDLGSGDLYKQTNWFARVEALIAALVFSDDGDGTNTVGVYNGQFDSAVQGASDLPSAAASRLSVFSDTSQGLVSSLRSLGNTFSSVADPGTVVLFNLPEPSGGDRSGGGDVIGFETSEMRNFVDVCRNATTLAWVSVGLVFLFRFMFWTVRTSYSLVVFSWGVLSSIFSH